MLKKKIATKQVCVGAIIVALCYVFTTFISIPISSTGYINLSDMFIVLTTISIDPIVGLIVAVIAPALADLTLGYFIYIPFTVLSKSIECLFVYLLFNKIKGKIKYILIFISSIAMASIYIIPDLIVLGIDNWITGLINFALNSLQGIVGISLALVFHQIFKKLNLFTKIG